MKPEHLTAYALGELHGKEREQFERELAASPDLQNELAATSALADALGEESPMEDLGAERRESLLAVCLTTIAARKRNTRVAVIAGGITTLAAGLVIASTLAHHPAPATPEPATVVQVEPAPPAPEASPELPVEIPIAPDPVAQTTPDPTPAATLVAAVDWRVVEGPEESWRLNSADKESEAQDGQTDSAGEIRAFTAGWSGDRSARISSGTGMRGATATTGPVARNIRLVGALYRVESYSQQPTAPDSETYDATPENEFRNAEAHPLSTFSLDVDTASFSNVRRFLDANQLPPPEAVRIEELINYFPTADPQPEGDAPFSVTLESARAPWAPAHELVRIGIKGRELTDEARPASNLVFLVDVSGSMKPSNKLPLLKRSLHALMEKLRDDDRVAIVAYAGSSGIKLASTPGSEKPRILAALDRLAAGGSTNGSEGIELAYRTARKNFLPEGNNRVILCTDGDFNVGITSRRALVKLIEKERASGVFLSVLGFGNGNLKDATMESLADKGNGNYAYIDSLAEGRKVLVEQMDGTLFTIAKDVKVQVEFNPARVASCRLIGYENRLLAKEDFNNDRKDAGDIGAGHSVTALYEVIPVGVSDSGTVDPLKYQSHPALVPSDELLTVKLRFKGPDGDESQLIETTLPASPPKPFSEASDDFRFAAAVAAFGMKLRNSPDAETIRWSAIESAAREALGDDPGSHRAEFLPLIQKARQLSGRNQ